MRKIKNDLQKKKKNYSSHSLQEIEREEKEIYEKEQHIK